MQTTNNVNTLKCTHACLHCYGVRSCIDTVIPILILGRHSYWYQRLYLNDYSNQYRYWYRYWFWYRYCSNIHTNTNTISDSDTNIAQTSIPIPIPILVLVSVLLWDWILILQYWYHPCQYWYWLIIIRKPILPYRYQYWYRYDTNTDTWYQWNTTHTSDCHAMECARTRLSCPSVAPLLLVW